MTEEGFFVESILGMDTGKALVRIQYPVQKFDVTVESHEVRAVAMSLLQAAEAADMDKMVFEFLTEKVSTPVDAAAGMIRELRAMRAQ